jgi:hypothetical protein
LNRSLPATDLSLPEARVLYELAHAPEGGRTAAEIGRTLNMDKGAFEPHRGALLRPRACGEPGQPRPSQAQAAHADRSRPQDLRLGRSRRWKAPLRLCGSAF